MSPWLLYDVSLSSPWLLEGLDWLLGQSVGRNWSWSVPPHATGRPAGWGLTREERPPYQHKVFVEQPLAPPVPAKKSYMSSVWFLGYLRLCSKKTKTNLGPKIHVIFKVHSPVLPFDPLKHAMKTHLCCKYHRQCGLRKAYLNQGKNLVCKVKLFWRAGNPSGSCDI